ncbi:hypothetical protein V5799_019246 [Amblyomma americanum]|uniref:Uncharacterized protein n=1 Tax=Amblyomma americanum TaxID=6943 RepID=A0AAQ4EWW9_AMBAM
MSVHSKLCWHEEIVYKFKIEWPPDSADILHHEQGIIESIVQMSREGQCPSSLSTAEFSVNIRILFLPVLHFALKCTSASH